MKYPTRASDHLHRFDTTHRNIVEQQSLQWSASEARAEYVKQRADSLDWCSFREIGWFSQLYFGCAAFPSGRNGVDLEYRSCASHLRRIQSEENEERGKNRPFQKGDPSIFWGEWWVVQCFKRCSHPFRPPKKPWASPKRWSTTEFARLMNRKWKRWLRLVKNMNVQCRSFWHGTRGSHRSSSFLAIRNRERSRSDFPTEESSGFNTHPGTWALLPFLVTICVSISSMFGFFAFLAESPFRHQIRFSRGRSPRETPTNVSWPCWGAFGSPGWVQHLRPLASLAASRTNPSKWFGRWRLSSVNGLRSISTRRSLNKSERISRRILLNPKLRPPPVWTRQTRPVACWEQGKKTVPDMAPAGCRSTKRCWS